MSDTDLDSDDDNIQDYQMDDEEHSDSQSSTGLPSPPGEEDADDVQLEVESNDGKRQRSSSSESSVKPLSRRRKLSDSSGSPRRHTSRDSGVTIHPKSHNPGVDTTRNSSPGTVILPGQDSRPQASTSILNVPNNTVHPLPLGGAAVLRSSLSSSREQRLSRLAARVSNAFSPIQSPPKATTQSPVESAQEQLDEAASPVHMDVDEEEDDSTPEDESLKCAGPSVDPEINFVVDNGPREMDVEGDSRNMEVLDVVLGKIARLEQSVEDDIRKAQMKKNELRMLTQDVTELQKAHECNKRRGEEYARRLEQNRGQREKYEKDIADLRHRLRALE